MDGADPLSPGNLVDQSGLSRRLAAGPGDVSRRAIWTVPSGRSSSRVWSTFGSHPPGSRPRSVTRSLRRSPTRSQRSASLSRQLSASPACQSRRSTSAESGPPRLPMFRHRHRNPSPASTRRAGDHTPGLRRDRRLHGRGRPSPDLVRYPTRRRRTSVERLLWHRAQPACDWFSFPARL